MRMSTRTFRLFASVKLCVSAVVNVPFHYSWRWHQNEVQYQQGRIIKDDWVGGQVFIPIESWGFGALGVGGALFAAWQFARGRRHAT